MTEGADQEQREELEAEAWAQRAVRQAPAAVEELLKQPGRGGGDAAGAIFGLLSTAASSRPEKAPAELALERLGDREILAKEVGGPPVAERGWIDAEDPELVDVALADASATDTTKPRKEGQVQKGWVARVFREQFVSSVSEQLPEDYKTLRDELGKLKDASRRFVADAIGPALNEEAASEAKEAKTYEAKKELAKWINGELRRFDLALSDESGKPAILIVTTGHNRVGRFGLQVASEAGKRPRITMTSMTLPTLKLMPVPFGQSRTEHQRGR